MELEDARSRAGDLKVFAFDASPDPRRGSISMASLRADGLWHVEVVEDKPGTGWLPARLVELVNKYGAPNPVCDERVRRRRSLSRRSRAGGAGGGHDGVRARPGMFEAG